LRERRGKLVNDARAILANDDSSVDQINSANTMLDEANSLGRLIQAQEEIAAEDQRRNEALEAEAEKREREAREGRAKVEAKRETAEKISAPDVVRNAVNGGGETRATFTLGTVGSPSTGAGNLAPEEDFIRSLTVALLENVPMRQVARTIQTSAGQVRVPSRSALSGVAYKAENASYASGTMTFDQTEIDLHKITAAEMRIAIVDAFAQFEDNWFIDGTGSSQAYGVLTGADAGVTAASATAITGDELIDLYHSLKQPYRPRAVWIMNDSTLKAIAKLKDGDGQYLWRTGLVAGNPDTILGRPVFTSPNAAAMEASAVAIGFGDMSYYVIADRTALDIMVDPYTNSSTGLVNIHADKRTGGKLTLGEAVKKITMAAS